MPVMMDMDAPGWVELMRGVVIVAARQAFDKRLDPLRRLDAALFLASDAAPLWLEACGLPDTDPIKFLTDAKTRRRMEKIRSKNG